MTVSNGEWWRGAAIYQIYPRSFFDSNGDGIGDLAGITQKLDYIADLGVDAIWLSPFFTSPMEDFGYDVQNYTDVDPIFGTLRDFENLVTRTHDRGLKVIIDQVYSHTSSRHPWFEESRRDRDNPKADWYVWADPKPDGSPPNNWQAVFTSPAWTWDARRCQYYLHNFLESQPDLNLHNSAVQDALLDVARFWLHLGVDGFRLDAINYGMHDQQLRDNPPAQGEGWAYPHTRPVDMQSALYNSNHEKMPEFLERLRTVMDSYPGRFTVAEVGGPLAPQVMKSYTQGDNRLNTAYSFEFLGATDFCAQRFADILEQWSNDWSQGWPSWAFSNHDVPRVASRWGSDIDRELRVKLAALLLIALRGNIFIYQGEELGLTQSDVPYQKLQDPEAIRNWPHTLGRDGARTPMPWDESADHAGFSIAEPWLPMDYHHVSCAASHQLNGSDSVLKTYQTFLKLRRQSPVLRQGDLLDLRAEDGVLRFTRQLNGQKLVCEFNFSPDEKPCAREAGKMLASVGVKAGSGRLPPWSGQITEAGT